MSIEMYKQANEELIKKVQELKLEIQSLQAELLVSNKNFFDERERRLEFEQIFNQLLKQAKRQVANVFEQIFENLGNISNLQLNSLTPPSTKSRKSSNNMRRRSSMCSGVTQRSPVKSTTTTTTTFAGNMNNDLLQQTVIVEETAENANSPYIKTNKNIYGLKNFTEETENLMSSVENSENVAEPNNSYRSVVDMGATAGGNRELEESETITLRTVVPRLFLNDRRATQIFSHATSPEKHTSTTSTKPVSESPNNSTNASANIDQLTADFSDNLQLHSTPRTSISKDESDATQTTLSLSATRPRRQCAPKKLVELPLNKKLRNDNDSKRTVKKAKKQK